MCFRTWMPTLRIGWDSQVIRCIRLFAAESFWAVWKTDKLVHIAHASRS